MMRIKKNVNKDRFRKGVDWVGSHPGQAIYYNFFFQTFNC